MKDHPPLPQNFGIFAILLLLFSAAIAQADPTSSSQVPWGLVEKGEEDTTQDHASGGHEFGYTIVGQQRVRADAANERADGVADSPDTPDQPTSLLGKELEDQDIRGRIECPNAQPSDDAHGDHIAQRLKRRS